MTAYSHAGSKWIAGNPYGANMSELGIAVADLLGDVFLGIYHLPSSALAKANWGHSAYIEINIYGTISTVDDDYLTRLVVLAHDRMIRIEMRGIGPGYLRMTFSQRKSREGELWDRCPTMEDHVATLRDYYGSPTP